MAGMETQLLLPRAGGRIIGPAPFTGRVADPRRYREFLESACHDRIP